MLCDMKILFPSRPTALLAVTALEENRETLVLLHVSCACSHQKDLVEML